MSDVPDSDLEPELQLQVNENVGMEPVNCPRCGSALIPGEVTGDGQVTATCSSCDWPAEATDSVHIGEPAEDEPARMTYPPHDAP